MAEIIKTTFQLRRGYEEVWNKNNPILAFGEPGFCIDKNALKIGDGIKTWKELEYIGDSNVASAGYLKRVVLDIDEELPNIDEADKDTIYMKKSSEYHLVDDVYDEYMVINDAWEIIGNTKVDLSEYLKTVTTGVGLKATKEANNTHIEIDTEAIFVLDCGTATELID